VGVPQKKTKKERKLPVANWLLTSDHLRHWIEMPFGIVGGPGQ